MASKTTINKVLIGFMLTIFFAGAIFVFVYARNLQQRNAGISLNRAAISGDTSEISSLISHGANVDDLDGDGRTPLMNACLNGQIETVRLLISRGSDVNRCENGNETPLLCAQNFPVIVRLLREAGALH